MKYFSLILLFAMATPCMALDTYATSCKHGDRERKIEVVYPNGTELPCEVLYSKETESQIIWDAKHDVSFCITKASELVEKHRSWGWECASTINEQQAIIEDEPRDDISQ